MARDRSNEAATETTEATQAPAANTVGAVVADDRHRMVKSPFHDGAVMKRADFIRYCWTEKKMSRGAIAAELTKMNAVENGGNGKKVPYQVVFAVIKKGTPGGPDPVAATPAAEAPAAS